MHSLDAAAEWFLRLNGFFTVQNFIVHPVRPEEGSRQRTDADVLGIRFPARQEVVGGHPLVDRAAFKDAHWPIFAIAEVKTGCCRPNGPWASHEEQNVTNVLRSLGHMSNATLETISGALYQKGRFQSDKLEARPVCFGANRSENIPEGVLQLEWEEAFGFIFDRYQAFWRAKRENQQWPPVGRFLWDRSKHRERGSFTRKMLKAFGVPEQQPRPRLQANSDHA